MVYEPEKIEKEQNGWKCPFCKKVYSPEIKTCGCQTQENNEKILLVED